MRRESFDSWWDAHSPNCSELAYQNERRAWNAAVKASARKAVAYLFDAGYAKGYDTLSSRIKKEILALAALERKQDA